MKPHERWWQDNLDTRMGDFSRWLNESDDESRLALYSFVAREKFASVLECGPGLFIDYQRFFSARDHGYAALEVTPRLATLGRSMGCPVLDGTIEAIQVQDRKVELVYCRHVLEHLPRWEDALTEMLRVASRAVVVIFFRLDEAADADRIEYNTVADVPNVYHNTYSAKVISAWLHERKLTHQWVRHRLDWTLTISK